MTSIITITVVIPAYNARATLGRALDSVLAQTRPADEIIVVDDGSTDDSVKIASRYCTHGLRLLSLSERRGASAARNAGIVAATGTWIAFLDADDEWLPSKLERQVTAIDMNPGTSFVFCASEELTADGKALGDTFRNGIVTSGNEAWKALLACNFIATPTVMASRALLMKLGGFDETLKVAEDQDMWIRLALAGPPVYVRDSLVRVHVQSKSLSSWSLADQYVYTLPMIKGHLQALSDRLSRSESRAIMGARLSQIGLITCTEGYLMRGLQLILRSALLGHRPLGSLVIMAKALLRRCLRTVRQIAQNQRSAP